MNIYGQLLVLIYLAEKRILAELSYPSKWIKPDTTFPWNVYVFETLLYKGLENCIESCKAKRMCEFVNFEFATNACSLVAANTSLGSTEIKLKMQRKAGYVFGSKSEWNMKKYESCSGCEPKGFCIHDSQQATSLCQNSGCVPPEQKPFAVILGNMFSVGNKIKYECEEGFTDVSGGTGQATCQENGTWTQTYVKCLPGLPDTSSTSNTIWIGGNDIEVEGTFLWSDGTPVSGGYENWDPGQPDESQTGIQQDCIHTKHTRTYKWVDGGCYNDIWSICQLR